MILVLMSGTVRKWTTKWCMSRLIVLVLATGCAAGQNGGVTVIDESSNLENEFKTAVLQSGEAYRAARTAILNRGERAIAVLTPKQADRDWKTSLTASILLGWLKNPALFDRCTAAIEGKLIGPLPITGSFPATRRIAAVSNLGKSVTPRLLEMALKTHELGDEEQATSIFGSLVALKDELAVVPLIETLKLETKDNTTEATIREWAASSLGPLQDRRAIEPLEKVLNDSHAAETLRAATAGSLGKLGAREALPTLRRIAADKSADLEFRKTAVEAIGELKDADSAPGLLKALTATPDLSFQLFVIGTVGEIGASDVLAALRQIEQGHAEEPVRDYAKEAREKIEERSNLRKE
jgi:hypothetical protein